MKYGLIGEKLGHSFSKEIHERLSDYTYNLFPLSKDEFHTFMKNKDFQAINVTIPYKKAVLPYLDELDASAKKIGAVNTIVNNNGKLKGFNTDYDGFDYMLQKHHVDLSNKKVLVLGNGGACAAIKAVVESYPIKQMYVVSRKAGDDVITYEECYERHTDAQIIVNTTPVGMYPHNDASPLDLSQFYQLESVIDIIYNPLYTQLCIDARKRNIQYIGGLEMLIAQAKYAVEHFTNIQIDESMIDEIYRDMLKKRVNIVLIGMPSCGKSTIAKYLNDLLPHQVIDLDEEIVKDTKMSIPDIFKAMNESGFRKIESEICKKYAKETGLIISTGGGIIKNEINMEHLQQNGMIIYIDRPLEHLIYQDGTRPLSSSKEAVEQLYKERTPIYQKCADIIISNDKPLEEVITQIFQLYHDKINNM